MECRSALLSYLILNVWFENHTFQVDKMEATKHLIFKDMRYFKKDEAIRSRFEQSYRVHQAINTLKRLAPRGSVSFRIANCLHFSTIFKEYYFLGKASRKKEILREINGINSKFG